MKDLQIETLGDYSDVICAVEIRSKHPERQESSNYDQDKEKLAIQECIGALTKDQASQGD